MTRPESITAGPFLDTAAVLRGWSDAKFDALRPDLTFDSERIFKAGDELAEALRAANPPINSESSAEADHIHDLCESADESAADRRMAGMGFQPAAPACSECHDTGRIGREPNDPDDHLSGSMDAPLRDGDKECPYCQPATPAVGEDAGADCECTCASELAEKVRVLLADVARLQKELDGTTFREERYAEDAVGARLALEDARADVARLKQAFDDEEKAGDLHRSINRRSAEALGKSNEGGNSSWHDIPEQIAALRATLAAVRKIAEDYHDVDVTGDPPREVACNPCANDILNVLEGRKP